jgi:phosphopantothenoylcysteine decarboxylase/phosphopantothenate--cysteine ligase
VEFVAVRSAEQMAQAVERHGAAAHVVVMAAAVSDYRPASVSDTKLKKTEGPAVLELQRTTDILKGLGAAKGERLLVGFAAETNEVRGYAKDKLLKKNLDLIVANDVGREGSGFASENNAALLIDRSGGEQEVPLVSKRELAERILDKVVELRARAAQKALARA